MSSLGSLTPPRSSSVTGLDDDDDDDIMAAMARPPVPLSTARKRPAADDDDEDDDDADDDRNTDRDELAGDNNTASMSSPLTINSNYLVLVKQYASRKKLKTEQIAEAEAFMQDPPVVRDAKLFINIVALRNNVAEVVTARPSFEVSPDLMKSINTYAVTVLLSSRINSYKGNETTNSLTRILLRLPLGIPPNIEANTADFDTLKRAAGNVLTNTRSNFKKLLSIDAKSVPQADIYSLTRGFIEKTNLQMSVPLCCRIALMRKTFKKFPGPNFWDKLDGTLTKIRNQAAGDPEVFVRAFKFVFDNDKDLYGTGTDSATEAGNTFQDEVDDLIRATALDVSSSVKAAAASI